MKKRINRTAIYTAAFLLAGSMGAGSLTAQAAWESGAVPRAIVASPSDGTDIYAGVIKEDAKNPKIRVEVPTKFAFVIRTTAADAASSHGVSSDDGSLLLPNVTVEEKNGELSIAVDKEAAKGSFKNYSTVVENGVRQGVGVELTGYIENKGPAEYRNGWSHTEGAEAITGDENAFKKYSLSVNGHDFSKKEGEKYSIESPIYLAAPGSETDGATGLAKTPSTLPAEFGVSVGGQKKQYMEAESSAKIGTITWTVRYSE